MAAMRDGDRVWTGDVAVPVSRLPQLMEETREHVRRSGLTGSIVGHVGDGNFHTILIYSAAQRKKAEAVVHKMVKRAIEMEGTVSIKMALDPLCLLNCDKVVRVQRPRKGEVEEW
ncbi:hypothetical protein E4U41_000373 [Claviceps citrina]|nr:hypothetical protein E4U41_000373 [Claviceps citrina]